MADEAEELLLISRPSKANLQDLREYAGPDVRMELAPREGMTLTFASFILAGTVPPYSDFLLDVLRHHGIRLLHLSPNSVVILAIFACLCHEYLHVAPSLHLFLRYYRCRAVAKKGAAATAIGSCYFFLRDYKQSTKFIPVKQQQFTGWKKQWVYVQQGGGGAGIDVDEMVAVPAAPAETRHSWHFDPPVTPHLAALLDRVAALQRDGLTGATVMHHAAQRRLAPLRRAIPCSAPAHAPGGGDDEDKDGDAAGSTADAGAGAPPQSQTQFTLVPTHSQSSEERTRHDHQVVGAKRPLNTITPVTSAPATDTATTWEHLPDPDRPESSVSGLNNAAHHVHGGDDGGAALKAMASLLDMESKKTCRLESKLDMAHSENQRLVYELQKSRLETQGARQESEAARHQNRLLAEELHKARQEAERDKMKIRSLTGDVEKFRSHFRDHDHLRVSSFAPTFV